MHSPLTDGCPPCSFVDPTLEHALDSAAPWALYVLRPARLPTRDSILTSGLFGTGLRSSVRCPTLRIARRQTLPGPPTGTTTTGSSSLYKTMFHLCNRLPLRSISPNSRLQSSGETFSAAQTTARPSHSDPRCVLRAFLFPFLFFLGGGAFTSSSNDGGHNS